MDYKIRVNVLTMLSARNYAVPKNIDEFLDVEELLTHHNNNINDKIYIFFPKIPKVGISNIKLYVRQMEDNNVDKSIIIVKDVITPFAKQVFVEKKLLYIEDFKESDFYIDKLKHMLIPKHELISNEDKENLLNLYKIKESQLPKILSSDPVSRYFGAKKGQVFKITRTSETAGEYIYYRIVV